MRCCILAQSKHPRSIKMPESNETLTHIVPWPPAECVEEFDHHCAFLHRCVGQKNYRRFMLLVASGTHDHRPMHRPMPFLTCRACTPRLRSARLHNEHGSGRSAPTVAHISHGGRLTLPFTAGGAACSGERCSGSTITCSLLWPPLSHCNKSDHLRACVATPRASAYCKDAAS